MVRPGADPHGAGGFTLLELVAVIGVLGIIAAVSAVALREPIRAYRDTLRRAEVTDVADTALRRMGRDLRLALPNSARVTGAGPVYLELLKTRSGGRYRALQNAAAAGDVLDFAAPDSSFDTLGPMSAISGQAVAVNDIVAVFNVTSAAAVTEGNAYTVNTASCSASFNISCNTARVTSTGAGALANETRISIASRQFPFGSPGNRFHVVDEAVTYECTPGAADASGDGTGTLRRVSGYTIALAQPTGTYAGTPVNALLAKYVTACAITYDQAPVTQRFGLVSLRLELTRGGERVTLYHEIHVANVP